MNFKSKAKEC